MGLEVFEQYEYLAIKGNPTVMLLLFVPEDRLVVQTPLGKELQELAPAIASRSAGQQFLGFLTAQKQRLAAGARHGEGSLTR